MIDSVTVQVDGGPIIRASLTHIADRKLTVVTFKVFAQVTGGQDPHTVAITATNDQEISVTQTVSVFTGPAFEVDAPAVLVDLINPIAIDPSDPKTKAALDMWASQMQQALQPLSAQLALAGKIVAGPNFILATNSIGVPVLRIGLWIEDTDFPVIAASPPDFPLPRLLDQAAMLGFNLAPLLPVPDLDPFGLGPSFAVSIPVTTLQRQVDAIFPTMQAAASQQNVTLSSITITTSDPGSVTTNIVGSLPLNISFTATITEVLGTEALPNANPPQMVPTVQSTSVLASLGSILDWLVSFFNPLLTILMLSAYGALFAKSKEIAGQIYGITEAFVLSIPSRIPFQNSSLSFLGESLPDFPTIVPNWKSFGVANSAIQGTATSAIVARDQSMVSLTLDGSDFVTGYQEDFFGGAAQSYLFALDNLSPDADKFQWQATGVRSETSLIDRAPFAEQAYFGMVFPLPRPVNPGEWIYTLTISGTETCGTDPSKTLSASASMDVRVNVLKNPKVPP